MRPISPHPMMNMMMPMYGSPFSSAMQCIACCFMLVGILFLVSWAFKTLTAKQLLGWGAGLLLVGSAVCLLATAHDGIRMKMTMRGGMEMSDKMMHMEGMRHSDDMAMDHDDMTMGDMSAMLEGKTGDAFDEAFIRMMIPHHQGAIDMVQGVEKNAKHQELKNLAKAIAEAQQKEIDMMNGWLQSWGYND